MLDKQILTQDLQKRPLISFIVTTYNLQPELLAECLDSIMALSLSDLEREVILVDDGSDIPAIMQLADYQDNIIYIRQSNRGLSEARNAGMRIATGKYIQFVDGDDYLLRAAYEHCLDLVRYHDPDIVYFYFTDKEEKENTTPPYKYSEPISGSIYLHNNNLRASAWSYIFRRNILQNLRFTPGILHEDEEFTPLLFLKAERVITTDAKAYFYRTRQDSIIHQKENKRHNLKRLADTELVIMHLQEKAALLSEAERVALNRRIAQLTMDYLYNTILLTRSTRHLEEAIGRLHDKGLYPLPDKKYTKKYQLFCKAIRSKVGRRLLVLTLPQLKQ